MNLVVEEMLAILNGEEDALMHYGMPRRSGRYPWGSGEDPYQHGSGDFLGRIEELKKNGWTETAENIQKEFGMTTKEYRNEKSWCNYERRLLQVERAKSLRADGKGWTEIGKEMGLSESTVRSLLNPQSESNMKKAAETASFLKKQVDEKGMIDVGHGVEHELNISKEKLDLALYELQREGYMTFGGRMDQPTNPSQKTTLKVLCPPGTPYKINDKGQPVSSAIYQLDKIHTIKDYISRDGGDTFEKKFTYPESLDSKRLMIRYKEDGGIDKDGIVELRPGKPDLSLGESRYSQVRIMVDGKKYIKGMAIYGDPKDFPDGIDVIFNTNKSNKLSKLEVLKDVKSDPDNPFGSLIKDADQGGQYWYDSKTGERITGSSKNPNKKLGLINKRADEGDWDDWANAVPSQFLAKQSKAMAQKQLNIAKADKQAEYEEICSLTNPTVKKYWLNKFADECDAAAVHLKAAALPGQKYHVIIPINTLDDKHVYAPGYPEGSKLALIRYPHGGTFEIPILTVTHKNPLGEKIIGKTSIDAVGINHNIADRLSGADFDGDTVMCIPTHDRAGKVKISSRDELPGLKGFDPKTAYGGEAKIGPDGSTHYYRNGHEYRIMRDTQKQMGVISNLITDMTLGGANDDELARAVRHSMVVIDAEKHKLDYKASESENQIAALKRAYQIQVDKNGNIVRYGGAATLLSRAKGEYTVDKRQGSAHVNVEGDPLYDPTKPKGAKVYKTADDLYYPLRKYDKKTKEVVLTTEDGGKVRYKVDDKEAASRYEPVKKTDPVTGKVTYTSKDGSVNYKVKTRTQPSTRMAETDDAYTLLSYNKHPMEIIYADYANSMKSMANKARLEAMATGNLQYNKAAKDTYREEVSSLMAKLNNAELNAVRERAAMRKTNVEVTAKKEAAKAAGTELKTSEIKKANQQALSKYRQEVGSVSRRERSIKITDREWEAIQAGAITESKLNRILNNTDADNLRERSMPKTRTQVSQGQVSRIKAMSASYTIQQIADKMGLSTSTVSKYLKGKE